MTNAVATNAALQEWRPVDWPEGWIAASWSAYLDHGMLYTRATLTIDAVWLPSVPTPGSGTRCRLMLYSADEWPYYRAQLVAFSDLLRVHRWAIVVDPDFR